ncbi:MAG: hypothetical protein WDM96_07095 [Lacunisphaera sp.]
MIRPPHSDFWQAGIVQAPITTFLDPEVRPGRVRWLPDPGPWRYLADPFGVQRDGATHVFVEAFDYRTKHGVIEHHEFGPRLDWRGKSTVLAGPHHLSYPYLIEHAGETFMIPECHRAGEVVLYRAQDFPRQWVREAVLLYSVPASEVSILQHDGRWWMFFTVVGPNARDQRELHVAFAEQLTGPWQLHAANPVVSDRSGARPGGTPFVDGDGRVVLPVQDCGVTYGGAVRLLKFMRLSPEAIVARRVSRALTGDLFSSTHTDGCHTLARCGDLTLIDTKRIARSWSRHWVNLQRNLSRSPVPVATS